MKKTQYYCDICQEEIKGIDLQDIQVIFHTEQTEGRSCGPYLSNESLEICETCYQKVLDGNYIHAHGAQGHNKYYFNTRKDQS